MFRRAHSNIDRRRFLAASALGWMAPVAQLLAREAESDSRPARSIIYLWLDGGPSQLETFDPHPGSRSAGGTKAIDTATPHVRLAEGLERLAPETNKLAIIRSVISKEGDHERATYLLKTGYRPDPSVIHPSIGAICCHELPIGGTEIPRHISILTGRWPSRGGFLGGDYDAFQIGDPEGELPDVRAGVPAARDQRRLRDLDVVERSFARGRQRFVEETLHRETLSRARTMMSSAQLRAFNVSEEPAAVLAEYGHTAFGRGCLAARRLIEVGVRCVEVTLGGWDSHVNNHEIHNRLVAELDPAFSALIRDLARRDLLAHTVVLCGGEFGRTPKINLAAGRDHWTNGFSIAIAGGGIRAGIVLGETDPEGVSAPRDPVKVEDIHATVIASLGLEPSHENTAPSTGRPVKLSEGKPIHELLLKSPRGGTRPRG